MENNQALKVECFKEVLTKQQVYNEFYKQFDFCIIGQVNYFLSNSAGGKLTLFYENGLLTVGFDYEDIFYLSKEEAEELLLPGQLISIYGSNKLAEWKNNRIIASYIEKIN